MEESNESIPCSFSIEDMDFHPAIVCSSQAQCEAEWPCEIREYWHDLRPFNVLTRGLNSYGTIITCILGTFFNGLSFYILISSGLAKKGSGVYLTTLAICDICNLMFNYAVGVARGELREFDQYFLDSVWLCRFHSVSVDVFQLISAWIVVSFTIERCIAIWYPMLLRTTKRYRSKVIVGCMTLCLSLFSLSKLFIAGFEKDSVYGYNPCDSNAFIWQGMAYVRVAFQTWIPTLLVFLFNCLLFWKLRRIRANRKRLTAYRQDSLERQRRNLHLQQNSSLLLRPSSTTPMLIAVSLAYLILVFPLGAVQTVELYWNLKQGSQVSEEEPQRSLYIKWLTGKLFLKNLRAFFFGLYQINFSINFFLYCAAGVQFRVHLQSKIKHLCSFLGLNRCAFIRDGVCGSGQVTTTNSMDVDLSACTAVCPARPNNGRTNKLLAINNQNNEHTRRRSSISSPNKMTDPNKTQVNVRNITFV